MPGPDTLPVLPRQRARAGLVRPASAAGWPLTEVTDPFVLEVHRPVRPEDAPPGLAALPPYVPREHDQVLGQVVRAAGGRSGIAVLVGGSSSQTTLSFRSHDRHARAGHREHGRRHDLGWSRGGQQSPAAAGPSRRHAPPCRLRGRR